MKRRLAFLVPAAIVVGAGLAFAGIALYFASRGYLPGTAFSDARDPLIGTFLFEYWYTWLAIAAGLVGFGYLGHRVLRVQREDGTRDSRPFTIVIRAELAGAVGTIAAYAILLRMSSSDWF